MAEASGRLKPQMLRTTCRPVSCCTALGVKSSCRERDEARGLWAKGAEGELSEGRERQAGRESGLGAGWQSG